MPILATGILTLLLVFYSGYAVRGQNSSTVSEMVASSFLYSMLVSWIIFLTAYIFDLSAFPVSILIIAVTGLGFWYGNYKKTPAGSNYSKKDLIQSLIVVFGAAVVLFFTYLYIQKFYTPVFTFWDVVASYNNWAIELANGGYHAGGTAYPILYPGLWSLIYRLQDDPGFWIFSKITLLAAPVTLFVYSVSLSLERRSLFPIIFILACFGLVIFRTPYFLSGMMDIAVSILGMLTCLILWKESTEEKPEDLSLLAAGITSLVKQAGLAFLLLAVLIKSIDIWKGNVSIKQCWKPALVAVALPFSFMVFFLYYNDIGQIPAGFLSLRRVAENAANGSELIPHALNLAYSYLPLTITLPLGLFLFIGIYLSTPRLRLLQILSLVIASTGFLIWILFTSYDIRNFYWSIILVIFAATIGLDALICKVMAAFRDRNTPGREEISGMNIHPRGLSLLKPILIILPLLSLIPLVIQGDEKLQIINNNSRNEVIPPSLRPMFERTPPGMPENFILLTNVQPLAWAPRLKDRIEIDVFRGKYQSLRNKVRKSEASILLVKKLPDGGGYPNIQKLKDEQLINQVVDSKLYTIYTIQR